MKQSKILLVCFIACCFLLSLAPALVFASDPQNCLFCHKYKRLRVYDKEGDLHNYYVDTELFHKSIHREVTCVGCHSDINQVPHGEIEKVTCVKVCHLDRYKNMTGYNFSHKGVAENLQKSVHGVRPDDPPEVAALKPDCKYCHLNDLYVLPEEVPSEEVLKRCKNCHTEKGLQDIFTHISHRFKHKTSRPPLQIVELCASCHSDEDFNNVMGFSGARAEAVDTYKETIHYRILQMGGDDTAQCVDCHASESIHDIRPPSDPESSIHVKNRHRTCQAGNCHTGASPKISAVDSHLSRQKEKGPEIHIVEVIMEAVMFATLFFLFALMLTETYGRVLNRDARFFRWLRKPQPLSKDTEPEESGLAEVPNLHRYVDFNPKGDYKRYSIHIVINHAVMAISFVVATATGLPLFFHNSELSYKVIQLMGGIDVTRMIHRVNAIVFTVDCLYHVIVLLCGMAQKTFKGTFDVRRTQFPMLKDAKDLYQDFLYFLGLRRTRPLMEKFMYKQKIHYLAMIWGCSVLALSGCCLLWPEIMVQYLPFPKISMNILRLMHAEESVLAFLVITLWHMYNVHIAPGRFPVQWTFINGLINKDHQIEEHFLEYRRQVAEGAAESEEEKLLKGGSGAPGAMRQQRRKRKPVEAIIVFAVIAFICASASGYLTFKVQFVRRTPPKEVRTAELSYQTLRIKDQERKQQHDHFHQPTEDKNLEAWADKSSCIACHSPYPHGKKSKAKALLNLHTEFLTCHSCHLKLEEGQEIKFGWINPTGGQPKGRPYGTAVDPRTGLFVETDDHYSKMTPYRKIDGAWIPVIPQGTTDIEIDFSKGIDPKYMEKWRKLHKGTELDEFIRCTQCHTGNGILNFRDLGFDEARINQLEKLEIGGMFSNYETFYFPELYREKFK